MEDHTKPDPSVPPHKRVQGHKKTGPTETRPGGCYIQGGTPDPDFPDKHWGGKLVNANGETLATFADDQINTGVPEDGTLTDPQGNPLPKVEKAEPTKPEGAKK